MVNPPKLPLSTSELNDLLRAASLIFDGTEAMFIHSSQANTDVKLLCLTIRQCTVTLAAAILALK